MSFHGGVIGVSLGILYLARKNGLSWLRVHDYVACCVPFGLFFGLLTNFVNGELWGKAADVPWAIVFPCGGSVPRPPIQLFEGGLVIGTASCSDSVGDYVLIVGGSCT